MRTIHFISGLPRAGSTLLAGLLAQNPRFGVTGTSGLVDVLLWVRNGWDRSEELRAMATAESEATRLRVLRSIMSGYHPPGAPVAIDKARAWLAYLEMAELLLESRVKVLVPVRDVRDILASLEMLWRRAAPLRQIPCEARAFTAFQSLGGRTASWLAADGLLGIAYNRLQDAILRGLGDRLHLVSYERLTTDPHGTLAGVYDFLGEEYFQADCERVTVAADEDDRAYGVPGLHDVRRRVEPAVSRWREILGPMAEGYGQLNFWEGNHGTQVQGAV